MSEYRISEEQYRKFRRRYLTLYVPGIAVMIAVVALIDFYATRGGGFPVWIIIVPLFLVYFSFVIYRSLRRARRMLMSYTLVVTDTDITREQDSTPTISINFMEIKEIIRTRKGAFLVKGLHRTDLIAIPRELNETGVLEQELQTLAPITTDKKDPFMIKHRLILRMVALGMFLCLYTVHNKPIIAASALLLSGLLGWSVYETQISKNVTSYAKRSSWLNLLIIAAILYLTYIKITLPEF
jgi:hypothetical protein